MKTSRFFALICAFALMLSLCACGESTEEALTTRPVAGQDQLSAEPTLPFKETIVSTTGTAEVGAETVPTETTQETTAPAETTQETTAPAETTQDTPVPAETAPDTVPTVPTATQPTVTVPKENPYINEAGQTVFYYGGGNLVFGWDENGERYSYVVQPDIYVFDVTPKTLTAADWNSWSPSKQIAFDNCFSKEIREPEGRHNYLWVTRFDCYDCSYEGHACRSEDYHKQLMIDLATPCYYCGQTNCPSYLALDPQTLFTEEDPETCPKYDKTRDPFFYCQKCHKTKWGKPSESCNQYLADVNCYTCGEPVKAHACHTCAFDEDIYDEYTDQFIAPRPTTPVPTTPEPTTPEPTTPEPTTPEPTTSPPTTPPETTVDESENIPTTVPDSVVEEYPSPPIAEEPEQ